MFVVVGPRTIELFALTTASRTDSARNQIDAACLAAPYRSHMISSTWFSPSLPAVANEPFLSAKTFGQLATFACLNAFWKPVLVAYLHSLEPSVIIRK
jgi:hypothetical protein